MTEIFIQEWTTTTGKTIRVGDRYHDRRESNRRTLRVNSIVPLRRGAEIGLCVELVDGDPPARKRATAILDTRLTGRDYIRIEQTGAPA